MTSVVILYTYVVDLKLISSPPPVVNELPTTPQLTPSVRPQQPLLLQVASPPSASLTTTSVSVATPSGSPAVSVLQLRPAAAAAPGTPLQLRQVAVTTGAPLPFTQTVALPGGQQVTLRAVAASSGVRIAQVDADAEQRFEGLIVFRRLEISES
jgi:hypothetical protein